MHVQLIAKADSKMTGLRRYEETLFKELAQQGLPVQRVSPEQSFPRPLTSAGRRLGWDLSTFFQSYPLKGSYARADVYHLASESLATALLFNDLGPSVVTVHGLLPYLLRKKGGRNLYGNRVHQWFDALSVQGLRRADRIIAVSHFLKDELVHYAGIPGERIEVIHEAVDRTIFRPQAVPDAFRERYGLTQECHYILYVGSEQPEKNLLTLIRAFAVLSRRRADVKLLKVGQPEFQSEREAATRLIHQLGIEKDVVFLGHMGDDLTLIYNASDLFVFPSRFEGFGFPPLEAMACGIPVICSDAGALPEVVGDAALLVHPMDEAGLANGMERMLRDHSFRKECVARGLENARRFSWDATARRTIEVYEKIGCRPPM